MTAEPPFPAISALTDQQAEALAGRAFFLADDKQWWQIDAAAPADSELKGGDLARAYVAAAMALDPPVLTADDLPTAAQA
ncbi:hypothetical protein GXW82_07660 [Streptacidiphilus sp. 4-A2]|nr:hypothetical protein [Streptacidiphilus sp. 4-A2]